VKGEGGGGAKGREGGGVSGEGSQGTEYGGAQREGQAGHGGVHANCVRAGEG
jgi:hypothetical protein